MPDRRQAPSFRSVPEVHMPRAITTNLTSGVPLHYIKAGQHEIVWIELIFRSGRWYESFTGISDFTSCMLSEGTLNRNAREIAEYFDSQGAQIHISPGADIVNISIYVMKKKAPDIIPLLLELLLEPSFPEYELEILADIKKQQILVNNQKNNIVAGNKFRETLYSPAHPYGYNIQVEDIDQHISKERIEEYYKSRLLKGFEIIISGNVDDKIIEKMDLLSVVDYQKPDYIHHAVPESADRKTVITREGSLQTSIRYGRRIISKNHEDYFGLVFLNELLGGFFGSRLMKNIREEKGYTYGIHSGIINRFNDSFWVIGTDVERRYSEATVEEIKREMRKMKTDKAGDDELDTVRNYLIGSFLTSMETSFSLADKFKGIYFFGLDYEYYDRYIRTVNQMTGDELMRLSNRYLEEDKFSLVLVGGE